MTSVRRLFALGLAASLSSFLLGCRHTPPTALGPFYIMLTYNSGSCQQNGSTGVIDVPSNQNVIYQAATSLSQFNASFSGNCPFAAGNCPVNSPNGTPMNVGLPNGNAVNSTFMYSGLTMDNQQCTDAGAMGVRIKPGP